MGMTIEKMIQDQLIARGITDKKVIRAMREIDRKQFVPDNVKKHAYEDGPLPIGEEQTISQPYIVAYMIETLELSSSDRVLEIGTGSGYNAAVMSRIAGEVYSVEIISRLADLAEKNIESAGIDNVFIRTADGYEGWKEKSPFDVIVLTAASNKVPPELQNQLRIGGKLILPLGRGVQDLVLLEKYSEEEFSKKRLVGVRFVPLTGGIKDL